MAIVVALAVLAGVALRVWVLRSSLGGIDQDEAAVGLQAQDFLGGDLDAYFPPQAYGGTGETVLIAAVFALVGPSVLALKLVPILLHAAACIVVWRTARRLTGIAWRSFCRRSRSGSARGTRSGRRRRPGASTG